MWNTCDFLAKVKEIEPSEFGYLKENQMIYCCIHPAGHPEEVQAILDSKCIAITAEDSHRYGSPNCEAAGKQGALFGLESMLTINGGKGKFVGGFAGAPGMNVLILGGGLLVLVLEWSNPETLGDMPVWQKVLTLKHFCLIRIRRAKKCRVRAIRQCSNRVSVPCRELG